MSSYVLFCMGNPLLDMQIANGEKILAKYELKANDAILADAKHEPIYAEIVKDYKVTYVAGGGAQNAARGAAYILPPKSVVYTGSVGDDELAHQLKIANEREGLTDAYLVKKGEKTGACAVIITGHHRSLVTTLRAAEKFDVNHLSSPEVAPLIDAAKVFYVEGYFLTHGFASVLALAQKASAAGKVFALNISAPFIPQFFSGPLSETLAFCDIVIGNESEAESWATSAGIPDPKNLQSVIKALAALPKKSSRPRVVIITQGTQPTILVSSDALESVKTFPVHVLRDDEIVDTNAAGDAFAGGFLGAFVAGRSVEDAVVIGHKLATMCVKQVGPQYQWPKVPIL